MQKPILSVLNKMEFFTHKMCFSLIWGCSYHQMIAESTYQYDWK